MFRADTESRAAGPSERVEIGRKRKTARDRRRRFYGIWSTTLVAFTPSIIHVVVVTVVAYTTYHGRLRQGHVFCSECRGSARPENTLFEIARGFNGDTVYGCGTSADVGVFGSDEKIARVMPCAETPYILSADFHSQQVLTPLSTSLPRGFANVTDFNTVIFAASRRG